MDCLHIPDLAYSDFSQRLHKAVWQQRVPLVGSLELTYRCNLRCQHCYLDSVHGGLPGQKELSTAEVKRILDEVVDAGCLWFLLTGGEPLLRRDFAELYLYAKRKGLLLTVFTNGTLITPHVADLLAEWRPFDLEITLYGYTQQTYERVTGIAGSHARCMRGIELLLERKVPLKLKTMLMTLNQHELQAMRDFADSLGLGFRYDPMLNSGLHGDHEPVNLRITPQQVVQFDLADMKRMEEWQQFSALFSGRAADERYLYQCGAGINTFHIDPYGQLCLCMIARTQSYDLRQGTFREGWGNHLAQLRFKAPEGEYACGGCELLALCGQCPGWSELEQGDSQIKTDYLCQVAHLRARAFNFTNPQAMI
jgi:radical SAM protein with 4Fe4S-binding SPASM domain